MKKFLLFISAYFFILYLLSVGLQTLIDKGLRKYDNNTYIVLNNIFNKKINADIIILGSSRAKTQIDPKIIEDSTRLSCYNLGVNGGRLVTQNAIWKSYLNNNSRPKIIIQSASIFLLPKDNHVWQKEQFLPYLSEYSISSNLTDIDNNIWLENIIPLYKYRGLEATISLGLKSYFNLLPEPKSNWYKGFANHNREWNFTFEKYKATHEKEIISPDSLEFGLAFLKNLIEECKKLNIKLILVEIPIYYELQEMTPQKDSVDLEFENLAKSNNYFFWNYTRDSLNYSKKYFWNSMHLNKAGAEIFSEHLAKDLKKFIDKN